MSKQWQIRRGTSAENDGFTGAQGEITMDTERKAIRIHDEITQGGVEVIGVNHIKEYLCKIMPDYARMQTGLSSPFDTGIVVGPSLPLSSPWSITNTPFTEI